MATYKVIQDIEAEDQLLGPLSLRQFIYAAIVVIQGFIAYKLIPVNWLLIIPMLPTMILFGFLAAPFGHDQPSEIWLLARIRFALKPRRRIWDQSGLKQLVTITAPKRVEKHYTDGLSQTEVKSRLRALADTIDSHGWAVKNVNINMYSQPAYNVTSIPTDRLVEASSLPQEVPSVDIVASDDMMDAQNNPLAQQLDQMILASAQAHREEVLKNLKQTTTAAGEKKEKSGDYWFMHEHDSSELPGPGYATFGSQTVTPGGSPINQPADAPPTPAEEALLRQLHSPKSPHPVPVSYGKLRVIKPLSEEEEAGQFAPDNPSAADPSITPPDSTDGPFVTAPPPITPFGAPQTNAVAAPYSSPPTAVPPVVTPPTEPAILELATNDDLNVATLAREADRSRKKPPPEDEVVVSLH